LVIKSNSFWRNGIQADHKRGILFLGIFLLWQTPTFSQKVIDLGVVGQTCRVSPQKIRSSHNKYLHQGITINKEEYIQNVRRQLSVSYDGTNKLNQGGQGYQYKLKAENLPFNEKRIYVFSALDSQSIETGKRLKADIGICIKYRSLEDIKSYREKTGVEYPIKLGNDSVIDLLRIKSYPSLLIIKNGEVTVETNI